MVVWSKLAKVDFSVSIIQVSVFLNHVENNKTFKKKIFVDLQCFFVPRSQKFVPAQKFFPLIEVPNINFSFVIFVLCAFGFY